MGLDRLIASALSAQAHGGEPSSVKQLQRQTQWPYMYGPDCQATPHTWASSALQHVHRNIPNVNLLQIHQSIALWLFPGGPQHQSQVQWGSQVVVCVHY
jgi:hypothetical protein